MNWKKIRRFLPIIGIVLFIYLLIKLNILEVLKEIKNLNFSYLPFIIAFLLIFLISQTLKWFIIARKQKINIPFNKAFKINLICNFYGFVTPGRLGSVIRADYLRKYKDGETGKGLSNFVIDKVLDLSSLFVMAIIFGIIFYAEIISVKYFYILTSLFLILILFSLLFYKKGLSKNILRVFYKKLIPKRMKEKAKVTFDSFYEEMPSLKFLSLAFIINILTWIFNYTVVYFIGLSLDINIRFIYFLSILPIATLIAQIPITISGLGTREVTMISLFGLFSIEAVKVFSMSVLSIIIMSIIPSIIAIFFLLKKQRK